MIQKLATRLFALTLVAVSCEAATITVDAQAGLAGNAAALAAFHRAAARCGGFLLDDVGVVISGDLQPLAPGTLGQASVQLYGTDYATMRGALAADASDETDDAIVAALGCASGVQPARHLLIQRPGIWHIGESAGARLHAAGCDDGRNHYLRLGVRVRL